MKIVIIGCGKIGLALTKELCKANHEITVIDENPEVVTNVNNTLDCIAIEGNGLSQSVQLSAGIDKADLMFAVTASDESNLLACMIAKTLGKCKTIPRVRNPLFSSEIGKLRETLSLAMVMNPDLTSARELARLFGKHSDIIDIDPFARGRVELTKIRVPKNSAFDGLQVKDLMTKTKANVLLCSLESDGKFEIPCGSSYIKSGDLVSYLATPHESTILLKDLGLHSQSVSNCMIIGGSRLAFYLAEQLIARGIKVKIIECKRERCEQLSASLPKADIICGDGSDQALLFEEGLEQTDAFISLTNLDEENVLLSLYAKSQGIKHVATKVNHTNYGKIIDTLDVGFVFNPQSMMIETVLGYVRARISSSASNVESIIRISDDKAEAIEFIINKDFNRLGVSLAELGRQHLIAPNTLMGCIVRGGKTIIPSGSDALMAGDNVIMVTTQPNVSDINDLIF